MRYGFLDRDRIYLALNKLRSSFLAAKDGSEVEEIMNGILTIDEKIRIGRRVQIAHMLKEGRTYDEIITELKVGKGTISTIEKQLKRYPRCFDLIEERDIRVERVYENKKSRAAGGSKKILKKEYTGFTRKDVKR